MRNTITTIKKKFLVMLTVAAMVITMTPAMAMAAEGGAAGAAVGSVGAAETDDGQLFYICDAYESDPGSYRKTTTAVFQRDLGENNHYEYDCDLTWDSIENLKGEIITFTTDMNGENRIEGSPELTLDSFPDMMHSSRTVSFTQNGQEYNVTINMKIEHVVFYMLTLDEQGAEDIGLAASYEDPSGWTPSGYTIDVPSNWNSSMRYAMGPVLGDLVEVKPVNNTLTYNLKYNGSVWATYRLNLRKSDGKNSELKNLTFNSIQEYSDDYYINLDKARTEAGDTVYVPEAVNILKPAMYDWRSDGIVNDSFMTDISEVKFEESDRSKVCEFDVKSEDGSSTTHYKITFTKDYDPAGADLRLVVFDGFKDFNINFDSENKATLTFNDFDTLSGKYLQLFAQRGETIESLTDGVEFMQYVNSYYTNLDGFDFSRPFDKQSQTIRFKITSEDSSISKECTLTINVNGRPQPSTYRLSSVKLGSAAFAYNGSVRTPAVTVKGSDGRTLVEGEDYTVTYADGRRNVGTYKVTVKGHNFYEGTITKTFKINPKGTTIKAPAKLKKGFTARWSKQSAKMGTTRITGYQVRYSAKASMTGAKIKTVKGYAKTSVKVKGLKAKKKYYVQVRTYKVVNGVKYYSAWSARKAVTTKK